MLNNPAGPRTTRLFAFATRKCAHDPYPAISGAGLAPYTAGIVESEEEEARAEVAGDDMVEADEEVETVAATTGAVAFEPEGPEETTRGTTCDTAAALGRRLRVLSGK